MPVCPSCGNEVSHLIKAETGFRLRVQEDGGGIAAAPEMCENCYNNVSATLSKGARLRVEAEAKEANRLQMWKSRVTLVKNAKALMGQKNFSDAAVAYEKYLRVLELVYDKNPGELTPELFRNEAKKQELTIITSVYWDLLRIYDTSPRYGERQFKAAEKLADFARFTQLGQGIMRKAELAISGAKNPDAYRKFLALSNQKKSHCFVATAAFNSNMHETVITLCIWRDDHLKKHGFGRKFVTIYYRLAPPAARWLDRHPSLKPPVRLLLNWLSTRVVKRFLLKP